MTGSIVERAARLDTATISDALDRLGIAGQCLGIKPRSHAFRLTGRAYTVLYEAFDRANPGTVGDYIDELEAGAVVVLDNGGREDATVWGDILTALAHRKGLAGTVIDGANRDTQLSLDLGYPVFSRSYSMRTGKDRVQVAAEQIPITIGGAEIAPGDLLRGDADGVVAIPKQAEQRVIETAERIQAAEAQIRERLEAGLSLRAAREELRYHSLHRPQS
jgi:regulator of RNase E activity RraA